MNALPRVLDVADSDIFYHNEGVHQQCTNIFPTYFRLYPLMISSNK